MDDQKNSPANSIVEDNKDRRSHEEIDVEKHGLPPTLQRSISGPPYSVFGKGMKIWIIFLVSVSALISPFGATTFLPALNIVSDVLHITPTQVNISITTYMVRSHTLLLQAYGRLDSNMYLA